MQDLTLEQSRQLIDVSQAFSSKREARKLSVGHYRWKKQRGHEYLAHDHQGRERSLGRRSPETEAIMEEHKRARARYRATTARLKEMARVNKALRLNRAESPTAKSPPRSRTSSYRCQARNGTPKPKNG